MNINGNWQQQIALTDLDLSPVLLCRKIIIYNRTVDDGFYYTKERSAFFHSSLQSI